MLRLATASRLSATRAMNCSAPALCMRSASSLTRKMQPSAMMKPSTLQQPSLRYLCSGSSSADDDAKKQASSGPVHVYEGAKNKVVQTLKKVSVANLGFAVLSTPLLQYITAATGNPGKGVAMSALLIFFGGGTTGALHWSTTTYVLNMYTVPGKDALMVTTPTFTGGTMDTEVAWADITRPIGYHPFATFEANGKKFYLDELGEMHDETFADKLEAALNK